MTHLLQRLNRSVVRGAPHHPNRASSPRINVESMNRRPRLLGADSKRDESRQPSAPYSARGIIVLTAIVGVSASLLFGLTQIDIARRELIDTDGYMRYARILDLLQGRNDWFDGWIHWSNSPFGHSMHWTRPLDALVIGLASPMAPFIGWSEAVYWAGLASGPLMLLALAAVVMWMARPVVSAQAAALAGLICVLQPGILGYSALGRLDHHISITAISLAVVGCTLRSLAGHGPPMVWAGVLGAVALWVSTEAILPVGLAFASIVAVWVIRGTNLVDARSWSKGFVLTASLALLVERGPGDLTTVEYDRISSSYLLAGAAGWLGVAVATWIIRRWPHVEGGRRSRLMILVGAMVLPIVGLLVAFPGFAEGPFADTPDVVREIWLSKVAESQPMWDGANPIGFILLRLGIPIVGLVCSIHLTRRRSAERFVWGTVSVFLVVMIPAAALSTRLASYPEALACIPVAAVVWTTITRRASGPSLGHIVLRLSLVMAAVLGHMVLGFATTPFADDDSSRGVLAGDECDLSRLEEAIDVAVPVDGTILANIDLGPILHVRTGRNVVATPHHRNVEGIIDAHTIMVSPPDEALRRIERRGIDAVVTCSSADEVYLEPVPTNSLYGRVVSGDLPNWLTEVDTSSASSRLFVVGG